MKPQHLKVEIKLLWILPPTMMITIVLCSQTELNILCPEWESCEMTKYNSETSWIVHG
jgi:hypothetical protein